MSSQGRYERCGDCNYWDCKGDWEDKDGFIYAPCRRKAPNLVTVQVYSIETLTEAENEDTFDKGFWPLTFENDWCGEFTDKRPLRELKKT